MRWASVEAMFAGVGGLLPPGGRFALYGPFRYAGRHTSAGNDQFDRSLRAQGAGMGIRDLDDLEPLAQRHGLDLEIDRPMPANNRTLIWRRERSPRQCL